MVAMRPNGDFTNQELMVTEAARHIQDGYVVLVGTGLPMVATTFAQKTHAPDLIYVVESGPIAPEVIPTPISVSDPKIMHRAVRLGSKREVLGCILQRGLKVTPRPNTIVTDLTVMEIPPQTRTMRILKLMPGFQLDTVLDNLQFAPAV